MNNKTKQVKNNIGDTVINSNAILSIQIEMLDTLNDIKELLEKK